MTAKEMALKFIDDFENMMYDSIENTYARENLAKQCALNAIDKIIENQYDITSIAFDKYWEEVRIEIHNLI